MFDVFNIKHLYILILLLVYTAILIVFHIKMKKDPELKAFFLDSLRENGKASGKSLTGLFFVQIIGFASIIAIIYSPNHLLPEYFLISILTFVGGLYGMKVASKYVSTGDSQNTNSGSDSSTENTEKVLDNVLVVDKNKDKNQTKPEDIG